MPAPVATWHDGWAAAPGRSRTWPARLAEEVPGRSGASEAERSREVRLALRIGSYLSEEMPGSLQLRALTASSAAAGSSTAASTHAAARSTPRARPRASPAGSRPRRSTSAATAVPISSAWPAARRGPDFSSPSPRPAIPTTARAVSSEWLLYDHRSWTWEDAETDEEEESPDTGDAGAEGTAEPVPARQQPARGRGRARAEPQTRSRDALHELSGSFDPDSLTFGLTLGESLRPMWIWPTRKRCPACHNYGPRPVITRVSLGTSAAVKVLSEGLLGALLPHESRPEEAAARLLRQPPGRRPSGPLHRLRPPV